MWLVCVYLKSMVHKSLDSCTKCVCVLGGWGYIRAYVCVCVCVHVCVCEFFPDFGGVGKAYRFLNFALSKSFFFCQLLTNSYLPSILSTGKNVFGYNEFYILMQSNFFKTDHKGLLVTRVIHSQHLTNGIHQHDSKREKTSAALLLLFTGQGSLLVLLLYIFGNHITKDQTSHFPNGRWTLHHLPIEIQK